VWDWDASDSEFGVTRGLSVCLASSVSVVGSHIWSSAVGWN